MNTISFDKYQGSGNDFILIDNRSGVVADDAKVALVQAMCPRAVAVGADGVIFLEDDPEFDFRWHFFNADGSEAEMCGNGARCAAVYAHAIGAAGAFMTFRTIAGPIQAEIVAGGARVQLTDAPALEAVPEFVYGEWTAPVAYSINTGVPHVVIPVEDLESVPIVPAGAAIRYHARFAPAGTNANFMARAGEGIAIRTYERGVEDETLACGTGSVAAAIAAADAYGLIPPVCVQTRSGVCLTIEYEPGANSFTRVFLTGPVEHVYAGQYFLPS